MSNLVKINEVILYTGTKSAKSDALKKALDNAGIKYTLMHYQDPGSHPGLFSALSTWSWGRMPNPSMKTFKEFPILTWKEFYEDWTTAVFNITSAGELSNSSLFLNKDKVA